MNIFPILENHSNKLHSRIGMPTILYLEEYGGLLYDAFGEMAYQVGSSLNKQDYRDVDVRLLLPSDKYQSLGFGNPQYPHRNVRWVSYVKAFSLLGQQMTGLPIDFQIQDLADANKQYSGPRSALIPPYKVLE
jgi:hypothetical protein